MDSKSAMEAFYQNTPREKIMWDKTQATFFHKIINSKKIPPGTALDLGCGLGDKSIKLAKKGFDVTAIDISPTSK